MWVIFQLTFSQYPMDWIESGVSTLQESARTIINEEKNPEFVSLISNGIIGGVGAVLSFLPNIVILFFSILLLETTGYMTRVAYLLDDIQARGWELMWRGYLFLPLWWLIFALLVEFWLISFLLSFFCVASVGCCASVLC